MDKNLIWYEYGDGISTTKNNKWAKLLYQDFEGTNEIIKNRKNIEEQIERHRKKPMPYFNMIRKIWYFIARCFQMHLSHVQC